MKIPVFFAALAVFSGFAHGAIRVPSVISSNMVLQRDVKVPIWGWADAGEEVSVSIAGQTQSARAGADGKWMVHLDPMKAGGPHDMSIKSDAGELAMRTNILVGEVWLCSGQSNMEWSVRASNNPQEEIANAKYPKIRLFHIPKKPASAPQEDANAKWVECSPENIPNFSAVGYFFGRHLHKELEGVPIGLIGSSWGGTRIEPWTPIEGFAAVDAVKGIGEQAAAATAVLSDKTAFVAQAEKWAAEVKQAAAAGKGFPPAPTLPKALNHGSPTGLYNGMVAPIIPYAMQGAIWYQGESNNGEGMLYHEKMKALIAGWRSVFNNPDLAFHFVQLAPYRYGNGEKTLPYIWEAQAATLKVPNTGMAVITDIGNVQDIHPRNKQDVGKRLALWALAKNYGKTDLVYSGPLYKSLAAEGDTIRVSFFHTGGGLVSRDEKPLSHFAIAGADGKFHPAIAEIDGETVVVSAAAVKEPKHVRFGWHHMVNPNLSNKAGLPASPFKTDDWKGGSGK